MQGVGSRRPLLLCPRGVPPARGCVIAWLRGCVPVWWLVVWWLGFAVVAGGMSLVSLWRGSCSTCLRLFVVVVWLVFVGGLGGIATIGAALRRVVGVSGVYGRKTPRVLARKGQRRVPVEGSMVVNLPCGCQCAVHLGGMRVTWGVWGVVDYGLGVVVRGEAFLWCGVSGMSGLSACCRDDRAHCRRLSRGAVVGVMGEWWPVCAQAGPLGGGVGGVPGLPPVGLTCAVEGLVLPPDTPSDYLRCPGRQV